eukprot:TRINITY_DN10412_c0_g1_i2.p1 TRINITY_DN10412_c0_g1~~TRINITY_DN10412_c0_g1_i2.p1  ORF type:complete len:204 (+),score=8.13 TRINITY_DN10412_c0_g1_i2:163-774(+)
MPKSINATAIVLIPKLTCPNSASDYRSIACCNVIYKAIANIIAQRIKGIIATLISDNQGAFIPHQSITHNILLAQELVQCYNRKHISPRCALKVDFKKAYDSVSWPFLTNLMIGLGFPFKVIKWILDCNTTPYFSMRTLRFFPRKKRPQTRRPLVPLCILPSHGILIKSSKQVGRKSSLPSPSKVRKIKNLAPVLCRRSLPIL